MAVVRLLALRLVASSAYILLFGAELLIPFIPLVGAAAGPRAARQSSSSNVLDLNYSDLDAATEAHPFLAVAFYSPGCGRCRRLLPSWSEAAELLEGERLQPIRLARMDVTSRGGMRAWKEFGLERVPSVKVFVGNSSEDPLPYKGHLDARGIVAHLDMLQRDRRRLLEHQDKLGSTPNTRRSTSGGDAASRRSGALPEPVGSGVTLLTFSSVGTSEKSLEAPVSDRFREAVGRERVSLVLFMDRDSPKARHMATELRKSVLLMAEDDHPVHAIRVDFSPPGVSSSSRRGGNAEKTTAPSCNDDCSNKKRAAHVVASKQVDAARLELEVATGVLVGDDPELRIFLDGQLWVDGGVFKGMPTSEGIRQHMRWVAMEAQLTSFKQEFQAGSTR